MAEPKIGVIHYNFPDMDWIQFLDYCARTGYEYIEVAISDVWGEGVENPEAKAKEARAQMDDRGIKAGALAAGNDFVLLDEAEGLKAGCEVRRTGRVLDAPVGEALLGRVVDPMGRPLDGLGPVRTAERWPVEREARNHCKNRDRPDDPRGRSPPARGR